MPQQSPMYQKIADDLGRQIEAGLLSPGIQLPTELELRDRYNASRNTVRDAIKRLISQGLVQTRPGQGTFVAEKLQPFVTVLSTDPTIGPGGSGEGATYPLPDHERAREDRVRNDPEIRVLPCPPEAARLLRLRESDKVVSRHERRHVDGVVWSLQTSYYPLEWVTRGASRLLMPENIDEGTIRYLGDTLDLRRAGYRDKITARLPTIEEQGYFGLSHGAAVFEIFRVSFTHDGIPMLVTATVYPADRNHMVYEYGAVPQLMLTEERPHGTLPPVAVAVSSADQECG
jgi:GntR family transcriptional regulator